MPLFIDKPTQVTACGNLPKIIKEYIGLVNTGTGEISIAHMQSPSGWTEPGQRPRFDEYTIVLKGELFVKFETGEYKVAAGQAIIAKAGEWVQYSTPEAGAEYMAVCLPAFSPAAVCRDASV